MLTDEMNESKTAILHIGLPKTGTTSIQRFLLKNQDQLSNVGIRYPTFLKRPNHVQLAAYAVGEQHVDRAGIVGVRSLKEWQDFRESFRESFLHATSEPGNWLFTSEHMASRLRSVGCVADLQNLLAESFDGFRVLLYVRRQDEMAASSYSTWIRDGRVLPFDLAGTLQDTDRYDFRKVVTRWQEVFGESAVSIRLYPRTDLLDDFAQALSLGDIGGRERPSRLNPSLTAAELEFLRRFNALVPRLDENRHTIRGVGNPVKFVEGTLGGPMWRLAAEDSCRIMERFAESNRWIMDRVDNPEVGADYFSTVPSRHADSTDAVNVSTDQAITVAARVFKDLDRTRAELQRLRGRADR